MFNITDSLLLSITENIEVTIVLVYNNSNNSYWGTTTWQVLE